MEVGGDLVSVQVIRCWEQLVWGPGFLVTSQNRDFTLPSGRWGMTQDFWEGLDASVALLPFSRSASALKGDYRTD